MKNNWNANSFFVYRAYKFHKKNIVSIIIKNSICLAYWADVSLFKKGCYIRFGKFLFLKIDHLPYGNFKENKIYDILIGIENLLVQRASKILNIPRSIDI